MAKMSSEELQSLIAETVKALQPLMEEESAEKIKKVLDLLTSETVADWKTDFKEQKEVYPVIHSYNFSKQEDVNDLSKRNQLELSVSDPDSPNHTITLDYLKQVRYTPKPIEPEKKQGLFSALKNKLLKTQETQKEQPVQPTPNPDEDEDLRKDQLIVNISPFGVSVTDIRTPRIGNETCIDYTLETSSGVLTKRVDNTVVATKNTNEREIN